MNELINKADKEAIEQDKADNKQLQQAILERERFSYSYWRSQWLNRLSSPLCCCCRSKPTRQDWLQKDAKTKLAAETDILEIIKKLRVHSFAVSVSLKPSQRDLVGFFDDYKLKTEADRKKDDKRAAKLIAKGTVVADEAGQASGEILNLDTGVKSGKQTSRILTSVMRVNESKERTDKVIIDRITNRNPRPRQNINILDFMNAVEVIKDKNHQSNKEVFAIARQQNVQHNKVDIKKTGGDDSFGSDDESFESEDFSESD